VKPAVHVHQPAHGRRSRPGRSPLALGIFPRVRLSRQRGRRGGMRPAQAIQWPVHAVIGVWLLIGSYVANTWTADHRTCSGFPGACAQDSTGARPPGTRPWLHQPPDQIGCRFLPGKASPCARPASVPGNPGTPRVPRTRRPGGPARASTGAAGCPERDPGGSTNPATNYAWLTPRRRAHTATARPACPPQTRQPTPPLLAWDVPARNNYWTGVINEVR